MNSLGTMNLAPSANLFAFTFGSPWMLFWLAAAAAPILIHFWTRRRFLEQPWAAMEYLMAAIRQESRRIRFEQLLLLVVRTLIIVLVVLAVVQLLLSSSSQKLARGNLIHKVLILDGSFSMGYQPEGKDSHF